MIRHDLLDKLKIDPGLQNYEQAMNSINQLAERLTQDSTSTRITRARLSSIKILIELAEGYLDQLEVLQG